MRLVADASVVVKTLIPEPDSDLAAKILQAECGAPDLIFAEVANVLWKVHRRGAITLDELSEATALLSAVNLEIATNGPLAAAALRYATALDHAAYDCFYLALAEQEGVHLITADAGLQRKVSASNLTVKVLLVAEAAAQI